MATTQYASVSVLTRCMILTTCITMVPHAIPVNITRFCNISNALQRITHAVLSYGKPTDRYANQTALVRTGNSLSAQEREFVQFRKARACIALAQELTKRYGDEYCTLKPHEVPTIGICLSGGGYRALFASLGYLEGLEEIGILAGTTYLASLSGSSWLIAPWMISQEPSITTFADQFISRITVAERNGPVQEALKKTCASNSLFDILRFFKILITKKWYGQSVALVDYFGFTIANPLLRGYQKKRFFEHTVSDLEQSVQQGRFPLPLFACSEHPVGCATWFEFSPYEFGSVNYGAYAPVWSFGRRFYGGRSIDRDPEQSLAYLLGMWGSGFAYSFIAVVPEIVQRLVSIISYLIGVKKIPIVKELLEEMHELLQRQSTATPLTELETYKFGTARIPNLTFGLEGTPHCDQEAIQLSDGGHVVFTVENYKAICHNFASVPLLHPARAVDIMIMCDSDRHGVQGEHMRASVLYAQQHPQLLAQFSPINYRALNVPTVQVVKRTQANQIPIIIAAACIPDPTYGHGYDPAQYAYTKTLNFAWLPQEAKRHANMARHIISKKESKEIIWNSIKEWVDEVRTPNIVTVPSSLKKSSHPHSGACKRFRYPTNLHWGNHPVHAS